jgi:hypothetical protein
MVFKRVLILVLLFYQNVILSQSNTFTIKNGLPSNNVYAVKQDKRGFIWATTDKGVVRYDGKSFKLYTVDQGLASNDNFAMLIDSKDNVWLYSFKAITKLEPSGKLLNFECTKDYYGQFLINSKDEIFFTVLESTDPITKEGHFANYIIKDDSLFKMDFEFMSQRGSYTSYNYYMKDVLMYIQYDFRINETKLLKPEIVYGHKYITNDLKKDLGIFIPISTYTTFVPKFYYLSPNNAIAFSSLGYRIFKNGRLQSTQKFPFSMEKKANGTDIRIGNVFYVILNKGIYTFNHKTEVWSPFLNTPKASSIIIDHEKNVWVSTLGDGLVKYDNLDIKTGRENVTKISTDAVKKVSGYKSQSLWIANSRNEILELKNRGKKYAPDLTDLRFLETDQFGDVYFGGSNAVHKNGKVFSTFSFKAMDLDRDSIALTTAFGVNFLDKKHLKSFRGSDNKQLTDVRGRMYAIKLLKGKFYSGNQQGFYWGTPYVDKLNPICLDDEHESVSVNAIEQTNDGLIWVATEGNGLYVLQNDRVIGHFDVELLDANIHALKTDEKNRVWLATRKGVNLVQKIGQSFQIRQFTSFHGLPNDFVNDVYCYADQLYVATDEGLVKVDLNKVKPSDFKLKPPVYINTFKVMGDSWQYAPPDSLSTFKYNQNTVNFEFSGISYKSNGNIRFEYKLLPLVNNWIQTTNDNITFNQLKPGNYTFEVRAIDAIGNVSEKPAVCRFVIQKHFTGTLWFKTLVVFFALWMVIFVVMKYVQYKRSKAEESNRVDKLISELRLKSLQAQLNPHFIFNSLNAIQQFINAENKKSANDYLSKFARLMRLYLNGSDTMFISLEQELEVLKLYCNLEHLRFADKFQYSIQIEEGLPLTQCKVPAMLLQPYVENAIKHGLIPAEKNNKLLTIVVKSIENGIVCIIEDNGIGRSKSLEMKKGRSTDHRSMGNKISKERLEMIRSLNLGNISEIITDIVDPGGQISGTNVQIMITKSKDDNP